LSPISVLGSFLDFEVERAILDLVLLADLVKDKQLIVEAASSYLMKSERG
jgi:hypothetical protein